MAKGVGDETADPSRSTVFVSYASQDAAVANVNLSHSRLIAGNSTGNRHSRPFAGVQVLG